MGFGRDPVRCRSGPGCPVIPMVRSGAFVPNPVRSWSGPLLARCTDMSVHRTGSLKKKFYPDFAIFPQNLTIFSRKFYLKPLILPFFAQNGKYFGGRFAVFYGKLRGERNDRALTTQASSRTVLLSASAFSGRA